MKFEEILPLMREGKKARHARMKSKEYWICGHVGLEGLNRIPTFLKVFENPFTYDKDTYSWGIERWAIMEDSWEIVE
jgi:hypothetical protein